MAEDIEQLVETAEMVAYLHAGVQQQPAYGGHAAPELVVLYVHAGGESGKAAGAEERLPADSRALGGEHVVAEPRFAA